MIGSGFFVLRNETIMAKLYFYYSAMNAGKSTTLLQSSYNYHERGMQTLLFTPIIDDRYQSGQITSRIGLQSQAIAFDNTMNLFLATKQELSKTKQRSGCILVDEAQFLTKAQVQQLTNISDELNIPVLCYGLRTDFLGEPFEGSLYLLALADELSEIKTICHCGKKATMNMRVDTQGRKVTAGAQIEIGGNDRYIATCRKHYKLGQSQSANTEIGNLHLATEAV